jgi:uncharacterized integral membrane protein
VTAPLLIIGVIFAVTNRQSVALHLWPFGITFQAPLFIVVLATLFVGFLAGGVVAWFAAGRRRRMARRDHKRVAALERDLEQVKRTQTGTGGLTTSGN